jgi:hypothetical protein
VQPEQSSSTRISYLSIQSERSEKMPNSIRTQPTGGRRASAAYITPASSDYTKEDDVVSDPVLNADEINGLGVPRLDRPVISEAERQARPFNQATKFDTASTPWSPISWIVALALLAGAAYYFLAPTNHTTPAGTAPIVQTQQPPAADTSNTQPVVPQVQGGAATPPADANAPLNGTVPKAN